MKVVSSGHESRVALASLFAGAFVFGLIWFPYRALRDVGVDGVSSTTLSYALALVFGLLLWRRSLAGWRWQWSLFWLALAAGGCNIGYVLATLDGEVMRVLLLFYLAPVWTALLARVLLGERLDGRGFATVALALVGAATMLWRPQLGWPAPQDAADWFGLGAGFCFALFNVLSRRCAAVSIEIKSLTAFAGVAATGVVLFTAGVAIPQLPPDALHWGLLALLGGELLMTNLVIQFGLERVPANRAIVVMLSELGFATLAAWLLAGESPGAREWIGGVMIIAAIVLSARLQKA